MTTTTEHLVERLFGAAIGALELLSIHLGARLGLYTALAGADALTPPGLAAAAGIDARYAREWLEQQAVAGFLTVTDPGTGADDRAYTLPPAHAAVLADPTDLAHLAPLAAMLTGIAGALPEVVEAYRTGAGVPYAHYGKDFRDGQGAINRPAYTRELGGWLAAVRGLPERLGAPGARIADVGCGQGWATIALARAFPHAEVIGVDLDPASIADARANAAQTPVRFESADIADAALGRFTLVCVFEALHDLARPVEALAACRAALEPGGVLLVADERVAEAFTAPGDEVERMMYGWSVTHCLPASRAESPSAALGTVLRADTVRDLAAAAGFTDVAVAPIDNDLFRFYVLTAT